MRWSPIGLSALVVGLAAPAANATIYNLYIFENADGADVSQLDLWVDVIDGGSYVDFEFHNDSLVSSFISSIYIEEAGVLNGGSIFFESAGVDFSDGATPPNPPGSIGGWGGTAYSVDANSPAPDDGINEGGAELLTLRMDYNDGSNYGDLLSLLDTGGMRIAEHIQGLGQDNRYSVWGTTPSEPVPLPASIWLIGTGLASWVGGGKIRKKLRRG